MPAKHSNRGRPKGSGLDDSGQLEAISRLIAADPELKPTTAIKALGISDPSTIRRLRDKYRKFKVATDLTQDKFDRQPKKLPKSEMRASQKAPLTTVPIHEPAAPRQRRTAKPKPHAPADQLSEPAQWFNTLCGLGWQSLSTGFEINAAALNTMFVLPPVRYAWRQQVVLNEIAIALYKKQKPLTVGVC